LNSRFQILQPATRTGADIHLVNLFCFNCADRTDIVNMMRCRYLGLKSRGVAGNDQFIFLIAITTLYIPIIPGFNEPSHLIKIEDGTFSHNSPVMSTPSISVDPMPVASAPNAPAVQV